LKKGKEYQDFIQIELMKHGIFIGVLTSEKYQITHGETVTGIEIKFDDLLKKTGNLFIETHEKSNAKNRDFIESGILRNDNTWLYAIGDYSVIYLISKTSLQRFYKIRHYKPQQESVDGYAEKTINTAKGFIIKADWVEKNMAAKVIRFNLENVI
jgi:hypothetical protein